MKYKKRRIMWIIMKYWKLAYLTLILIFLSKTLPTITVFNPSKSKSMNYSETKSLGTAPSKKFIKIILIPIRENTPSQSLLLCLFRILKLWKNLINWTLNHCLWKSTWMFKEVDSLWFLWRLIPKKIKIIQHLKQNFTVIPTYPWTPLHQKTQHKIVYHLWKLIKE